jgi:ABC-type uncharacterized transport system substrate-binding protein
MQTKWILVGLSCLVLSLFGCEKKPTPEPQPTPPAATPTSATTVEAPTATSAVATPQPAENLAPFQKTGNQKFRVAILESGEWYGYPENFLGILNALMDLGWMQKITFSAEAQKTIVGLLKELNSQPYSDYIEFPQDMYFSFDWDEKKASDPTYQKIITQSKNLDAIISFGTAASRAATTPATFDIPVIVTAVSDPVKSGIIQSVTDSGKDYVTAFCDPERFVRQVRLFYDVIKFKKLGLLYTDSTSGKTYAALDDVMAVAKEKGFEIVSNTNLIEEDNNPKAPEQYVTALKELAPKVDAIYLTIQAGLTVQNLQQILPIIEANKLPSFAMEGSSYVKHGVLFSISAYQLSAVGEFNAKNMIRIFQGTAPRKLNQIFSITPKIAINLKAAEHIGYDVPVDILGTSDEVYTEIEAISPSLANP